MRVQGWLSIAHIHVASLLIFYYAALLVILHITSPSKDEATKAMYDRFMAEDFCPYCLDDRTLGYLVGARLEEDGYVLTVNITDISAFDRLCESVGSRVVGKGARNAVA